jgi:hypothetical protein
VTKTHRKDLLPSPRLSLQVCLLSLGLLGPIGQARAQASATAVRTIGLSAFAGVQGVNPEFGGSPRIYGFLIGGDVTHYFSLASPSFEVRFDRSSGSTVTQRSLLVGFKGERALGPQQRFHPYLVGLIGAGAIEFVDPDNPAYTQDRSLVLNFGAGLDFDLTRHFAVKGDFHVQHWNLGPGSPVFFPELVSVALVYRPLFGRLNVPWSSRPRAIRAPSTSTPNSKGET